jgi:hypothetical protein
MAGRTTCALLCIGMAMLQPVAAEGACYEVFPEPDVRKTATNWVSSAYVVDKRDNQLWVCTARYDFTSKEPNKGECSKLPSDIGRHSLNESYATHGVVGSTPPDGFFRSSGSSSRRQETSCAPPAFV